MKYEEAAELLRALHANRENVTLTPADQVRVLKSVELVRSTLANAPQRFIEDYIKIIHYRTNELVPFVLNKAQRLAIDTYNSNDWIAVPKARQLGITTLTNALMLHHAIFSRNANVLCMAVKNVNAQENLYRIKVMFSNLPEWLKYYLVEVDKEEHTDNKEHWTFKSLVHNTMSEIQVVSAASEDSTRGKQPTALHWTETAFSDVADKVFTSVSPALRRRKGSKIVMESTGNGASGLYYEICSGKREGFQTVFLPWYLDEGYIKEGELTSDERDQIFVQMGEKVEGLSDEQLLWYRDTANNQGVNSTRQEYPVSVEQVFLSTNNSFFTPEAVAKVKILPFNTKMTFDGLLTRATHGPGTIYELPRADYEYLLAVDPSEGIIDPAVVYVYSPLGKVVAHWSDMLKPDHLVALINALGRYYNTAKIVCESNGFGQHVVQTLQHTYFYPSLHFEDGKPGVRMNVANKPSMLSTMHEFLLSERMEYVGWELAEQMKTFDAKTLKAQDKGLHDDEVMASALATWVFSQNPPRVKRVVDSYRDFDFNKDSRRKRKFVL